MDTVSCTDSFSVFLVVSVTNLQNLSGKFGFLAAVTFRSFFGSRSSFIVGMYIFIGILFAGSTV